MKILLVNKYLYPRGGAESYTLALGRLLRERGHETEFFGMADSRNGVGNRLGAEVSRLDFSEGMLRNLHAPFRIVYNGEAARKLNRVLEAFQPDVLHLNNIQFHLTPSVILAADRYRRRTGKKLKIVYTAHDYQLVCPGHGLFDGHYRLCEKCLGGSYLHCVAGKCVKGSRLKSALAALDGAVWRYSRAYKCIDRIICCSAFLKEKLDTNPVLREKTVVLHNFSEEFSEEKAEKGNYVLQFGHLSREKGTYTLLEAAKRMPSVRFAFAGRGEAVSEIEKLPNADYVGFQTGKELETLVRRAKLTVYPSQWPENCPLSVIESISLGTPVVASRIGGIPELVRSGETGELFEAGNAVQLEALLRRLLEKPGLLARYEENCGPSGFETRESYYRKLMKYAYEGL